MSVPPILIFVLLIVVAILLAMVLVQLRRNGRQMQDVLLLQLEEKHRGMLGDMNDCMNKLGDRLQHAVGDGADRLRTSVSQELSQTREAMQQLSLSQSNSLGRMREDNARQMGEFTQTLQARLAELKNDTLQVLTQALSDQGKLSQDQVQATMRFATEQLIGRIDGLTKNVETHLDKINGTVTERLDEGFKKTNETFSNVMARLATIDEAQKKIDGLTSNVVSLQELLGDKRSRGAFGEVQLEALVRNVMPPQAYAIQHTFSQNGSRADCVLFLPEPTGTVAVDSKFPMENYHRMYTPGVSEPERLVAEKQFALDVKKHIDDIAGKYIIPEVTSDGAVMFVPAEAVFAEIHGYHSEVVAYAMKKKVWIVSPTTLMAILNTARAVIKDVETRKQVHIIKQELGKLSTEFTRFDKRMKALADHIRQAHEDAQQVHTTSQKISRRFLQIEQVELGAPGAAAQDARLGPLPLDDED